MCCFFAECAVRLADSLESVRTKLLEGTCICKRMLSRTTLQNPFELVSVARYLFSKRMLSRMTLQTPFELVSVAGDLFCKGGRECEAELALQTKAKQNDSPKPPCA